MGGISEVHLSLYLSSSHSEKQGQLRKYAKTISHWRTATDATASNLRYWVIALIRVFLQFA
jgi:hypothetical protein